MCAGAVRFPHKIFNDLVFYFTLFRVFSAVYLYARIIIAHVATQVNKLGCGTKVETRNLNGKNLPRQMPPPEQWSPTDYEKADDEY